MLLGAFWKGRKWGDYNTASARLAIDATLSVRVGFDSVIFRLETYGTLAVFPELG